MSRSLDERDGGDRLDQAARAATRTDSSPTRRLYYAVSLRSATARSGAAEPSPSRSTARRPLR